MDRGAWWATVHGIKKTQTWLSDHSNGRRWRATKEPLDEGERREWRTWLKTQNLKKQKQKQKPDIMASGPITSWQIDGEELKIVTDFIFLGSKITQDGDWSHEIKRCLLLRRKAMTNIFSILKSRDITLPKRSIYSKLWFSSSYYGCESWTIKKTESRRVDVFKLCYWRSLLRVLKARKSN